MDAVLAGIYFAVLKYAFVGCSVFELLAVTSCNIKHLLWLLLGFCQRTVVIYKVTLEKGKRSHEKYPTRSCDLGAIEHDEWR